MNAVFRNILVAAFLAAGSVQAQRVIEADVCIYGGTSGGVAAAVQAARMGKKAVIAEPGKHLGGMTSGGLSAVDIGDPRTVGGIAREYFTRLVASYGKTLEWDKAFESKGGGPATGGAYSIEPRVAERVFDEMARESKVGVHFDARLASVKKEGARIVEFATEDGTVFRAKMFIDTTYEGDLMAKAGVTYTLMREGNAKYGETYNGIYYDEKYRPRTNHQKPGPTGRVPGGQGVWDRDLPLDPYVVPGDSKSGLLPLLQAGDPGTPGEPAPGVQAYCFRLCLTTAPDRLPIAPPPGYDPKRYELVARFIEGCVKLGDDMDLRWFSKHDELPNDKWDFNTATFGGNLPGASWEWPEATYARRVEIAKEHENYHRGLLHFLATDPRVPEKVRTEMKRFGLPRDEFTGTGGWPHQLYIREARRMVSDLVITERHTFGKEIAPNSVSLGSYGTDTHEIRRIVKDGVVIREGKTAGGRDGAPPYQIGYAGIVPRQSECENLFVTFALSASHTAFSSIRMEPVFMCSSQSAATAACLAIDSKVPVQRVDYSALRTRSVADGQVLTWAAAPAKPAAEKKPKTVRLLTVGNSFSGNATEYLGKLAQAGGHVLVHRSASMGGGTLAQHWAKVEAHEKDPKDQRGLYTKRSLKQELAAEPWDIVTIQQASILSHDQATYRPYAVQLRDFIKQQAPQAEVVVHQTWAYRRDDPRFTKPPTKPGAPATQQAMHDGLTAAYESIAAELGARIIPSGDAFHLADTDPAWGFQPDAKFDPKAAEAPALPEQRHSLHVGWQWKKGADGKSKLSMDGHHANAAGKYLAACVFYEFLFGESAVGNPFVPKEISGDHAQFLQKTAHRAVENRRAKKGP